MNEDEYQSCQPNVARQLKKKDKEEPAFPQIESDAAEDGFGRKYTDVKSVGGLTKREWFAGMAIQWYSHPSQWSSQATLMAAKAFELADAMIEASKK